MKFSIATLLFLAFQFEALACDEEDHKQEIVVEITSTRNAIKRYEVLVPKIYDSTKLAELLVLSVKENEVAYSMAIAFHDASTYEKAEVYKSHMKASVVFADSEMDSIQLVATYDQRRSADGALFMCAPEIRMDFSALLKKGNSRN